MTALNSKYLTLLMRAAAVGNISSVQGLLEDGADVNERGPRGATALMFAAGSGHLDIVKLLVKHGADLSAKEDGGWTALCHAKADEDRPIVDYLNRAHCKNQNT